MHLNLERKAKGQVSIEQIFILGFIILLALLILNFLGFFSDSTSTKINQSKIYWSSIASPFKISEFGLGVFEASDEVNLNLTLKISNPTSQTLVIKKLNLSKGNFLDVYENGQYLGRTSDLYISFLPGATKTLTITSFEPKESAYLPTKVFDIPLTIIFDSSLPNQIQEGSTPLTDYVSSVLVSGTGILGGNGCPSGYV
ncbi:MAG: hypothetical protein ACK4J0_04040, partial [Candidatus Anstonellaceae archaeon]